MIIALMVTVWSLVAVAYVHPLNIKLASPECKDAFASVYLSSLTFFQTIVAGDNFGGCTMPIMKQHPWTLVFFLAVLGSISLGLLNLVLSAIVDRAAEVRDQNAHLLNLTRLHCYEEAKQTIVEYCCFVDEDRSGVVALQSLLRAFEDIPEFQDACETLSVAKADLSSVFYMMDEDQAGIVDYRLFGEHLLKMKTDDLHSTVIMIKTHLVQMKSGLLKELEIIKRDMDRRSQGIMGCDMSKARREDADGNISNTSGSSLKPTMNGTTGLRLSPEDVHELVASKHEPALPASTEHRLEMPVEELVNKLAGGFQQMLDVMRSAATLLQNDGMELMELGEILLDFESDNHLNRECPSQSIVQGCSGNSATLRDRALERFFDAKPPMRGCTKLHIIKQL
jgi:hypothetical protein